MSDYTKLLELIADAQRCAYDIRMEIHDADLVKCADELEAAVTRLKYAVQTNQKRAEA